MSQANPTAVKVLSTWNPSTVVDAATGTGVGASNPFAIQQVVGDIQRSVNFNVSGTFSVCTGTLQQSFDGGNNYVNIGVPIDFAAFKAGNLGSLNGIVAFTPGCLYLISITTFTGTSITIKLVVT